MKLNLRGFLTAIFKAVMPIGPSLKVMEKHDGMKNWKSLLESNGFNKALTDGGFSVHSQLSENQSSVSIRVYDPEDSLLVSIEIGVFIEKSSKWSVAQDTLDSVAQDTLDYVFFDMFTKHAGEENGLLEEYCTFDKAGVALRKLLSDCTQVKHDEPSNPAGKPAGNDVLA